MTEDTEQPKPKYWLWALVTLVVLFLLYRMAKSGPTKGLTVLRIGGPGPYRGPIPRSRYYYRTQPSYRWS